jgi:hypothetical protein
VNRVRALVDSIIDWLNNWRVTLFGEHGEHDTTGKPPGS